MRREKLSTRCGSANSIESQGKETISQGGIRRDRVTRSKDTCEREQFKGTGITSGCCGERKRAKEETLRYPVSIPILILFHGSGQRVSKDSEVHVQSAGRDSRFSLSTPTILQFCPQSEGRTKRKAVTLIESRGKERKVIQGTIFAVFRSLVSLLLHRRMLLALIPHVLSSPLFSST